MDSFGTYGTYVSKNVCINAHKVLGNGKFGKIFLGRTKKISNEHVAVKEVNMEKNGNDLSEIIVMKKLANGRNINLVNMLEYITRSHSFYIVMDYCSYGDLSQTLEKRSSLTLGEINSIVCQLVNALYFISSQKCVHRDIKAENVFISPRRHGTYFEDNLIKLGDFGLSAILDDGGYLTERVGTKGYMAPEVIKKSPYGLKIDIWSLGVLLFLCAFGKMPFDDDDFEFLLYNINNYVEKRRENPGCINEEPSPDDQFKYVLYNIFKQTHKKYLDYMNNAISDIIKNLLQIDPEKRPSAVDLYNHPYIAEKRREYI